MTPLAEIGPALDAFAVRAEAPHAARALLAAAETVLEHWIVAHGDTPTADEREGFRLLALHHETWIFPQ